MSSAAAVTTTATAVKPSTSRSRRDKDDTNNPDIGLPGIGNYIFQKTVGEGNFAKVKLATHKLTNGEVAIKVIDKTQLDEKKLGKLYREVRIMKLLHHPNIVKLYEVIETKSTVYLVMEYASGGELYDYLVVHGKMKEKEARAKFRQILSAVSYCHKKRVIHRDLKAENLLLDANLDIKIADFGFSNYFDPDAKLDTFCGSPPYAAPELFQGRRYTGPEVDIWSLGVILYVLTTGCLPFDGKNLQEMRESVCRGKYRIPYYLSDMCEKLLRKFLVRDPVKRGSLEILLDDPWINESYGDSPISTDLSQKVEEDESVIKVIEAKYKVDRDTVLQALRDNIYNDIAAVYYLLYYEKATRDSISGECSIPDIIQMSSPTRVKEPSSNPGAAKAPNMMRIDEDGILPTVTSIAENYVANTTTEKNSNESPSKIAQLIKPTTTSSRRRRATVGADSEPKTSDAGANINEQTNNNNKDITSHIRDHSSIAHKEQHSSRETRPMTAYAAIPSVGPLGSVSAPTSAVSSGPPKNMDPIIVRSGIEEEMEDDHLVVSNLQSPINNRKRHNTIVGILRGQMKRTSEGPANTVHSPGGPSDHTAAATDRNTADEDTNKPRSLRFTFNSNTTSSKPPDEIIAEITKACDKHGIMHHALSRYLLECIWSAPATTGPGKEAIKFEIEVCKLPRLNNLHGLRFKRVAGSSADYKDACEKVLTAISL
ncbi:hypothetical protein BASA50_007475 [Batrachochytrium salamandrivorans]|uniref:non-specific serine/threonine protein kinase n=1 Tax=Batrachochytrium salamandrivorans TaxID=1357716 RepID=A0ABQ8F6Z5_9FUNG|nr:hypothetical protein BASA62_002704 [Batrachochytrium salamandrivorans]KAH6593269.1 hypothetical protein BASA50_007475 [Batrachochytrium salamandrivorans]KAH9247739.1 hypothetical protein BASA81_014627 [Batrachochytrium salamandrivorans]KAJ1343075.1 hypothetical protein BSLG_002101 [Batrachochytrium salamandrivorans]